MGDDHRAAGLAGARAGCVPGGRPEVRGVEGAVGLQAAPRERLVDTEGRDLDPRRLGHPYDGRGRRR
ncbi:hypothetical protein G5V59_13265 [Nocardioides sp. W3-2-3]|nr:hypothetical protein [Nocardioides convexus]